MYIIGKKTSDEKVIGKEELIALASERLDEYNKGREKPLKLTGTSNAKKVLKSFGVSVDRVVREEEKRTMLKLDEVSHAELKRLVEIEKRKGNAESIQSYSNSICEDVAKGKYDFLLPNREEKKKYTLGIYKQSMVKAVNYLKGKNTNVTEMIERVVRFKTGKKVATLEVEIESLEKFEELMEANGVSGVFKIINKDL